MAADDARRTTVITMDFETYVNSEVSALERAVETARAAGRAVDLDVAEEALQRKARHAIAHMAVDHFRLDRQNTAQHEITRSLRPKP
jgi:phosphoribosylaminoimidazole carboxylase (NCAIR synthetase)